MEHGPTAYALAVESKPGYLHVRVTGENTPETVARYLAETVAACRAHACHRVLIEEHLGGPSLSQMAMFGLIAESAEGAPPPVITIAYVDVNPRHDASRLRSAETTACNRGFLLHLFATVREADEWLAAG